MEMKFTPTFYVSCHVKEPNLYALLCALEVHKVGNVEVRPMAPPALMLPKPAPKVRGAVKQKAVNALAAGPKRAKDIAKETGQTEKGASQMLAVLVRTKLAKRLSLGLYQLRAA